jgi:hypothetical protein
MPAGKKVPNFFPATPKPNRIEYANWPMRRRCAVAEVRIHEERGAEPEVAVDRLRMIEGTDLHVSFGTVVAQFSVPNPSRRRKRLGLADLRRAPD